MPFPLFRRICVLTSVVVYVMLSISCKHEDLSLAVPNENIRPAADFIKNNYDMTLFSAALEKVGYADILNGTGPFTVLVPNDEAFNGLGIFNRSDIEKMNTDSLKKVIGYHILPRRLMLSDVPVNGVDVRYATLQGSELYTSLAAMNSSGGNPVNDLYFSGADVGRKDVVVANGVIQVLNKVMKPNFETTIETWLSSKKQYSVFVKGLKKFGLWDQLGTPGIFTVFAPDNKALENIGITEESLEAMDASRYIGDRLFGVYLLYDKHFFISDPLVFSVINSNGYHRYTLKNDSYYMTFSSAKVYPTFKVSYFLELRTGSTIYDPIVKSVQSSLPYQNDNLCSNGLVHHLVDGLVRPEQALKQ